MIMAYIQCFVLAHSVSAICKGASLDCHVSSSSEGTFMAQRFAAKVKGTRGSPGRKDQLKQVEAADTKHVNAPQDDSCLPKTSHEHKSVPIWPHPRLAAANNDNPLGSRSNMTLVTEDLNLDGQSAAYAAAVFKLDLNPSAADTTPVGYCINGLARTFVLPMVHKSFFRNLIPSFGGQATIFAIMVPNEEHSAAAAFDDGPKQKEASASKLREVLQSIGVTQFEIDAHDVPNQDIAVVAAKTPCQSYVKDFLYSSFVSQLVHSRACWTEMAAYEEKVGVNFSYMVYSRPDVTWYSQVAPHTDVAFYTASSPVGNMGGMDHAMFGTRAVMEIFFKRLDWHEEQCIDRWQGNPIDMDWAMGIADGLPFYFERRGLRLRSAHMPVVIVRDEGAMKTAKDACRWQADDFGGRKKNCMCALYEESSEGVYWGKARSDPSGPWW